MLIIAGFLTLGFSISRKWDLNSEVSSVVYFRLAPVSLYLLVIDIFFSSNNCFNVVFLM